MAEYGNIQVDGLLEATKDLEHLMMTSPNMEAKVQKLVRKVLARVKSTISKEAKMSMQADPRDAYKAVRTAVYRQILGGNVNILQRRKAGAPTHYERPRLLRPGQHGGNRTKVSDKSRTTQIESYAGADRGFILRFINAGTETRTTKYGNRGAIRARNFFGNVSASAMDHAVGDLTTLIDQLIKEETK